MCTITKINQVEDFKKIITSWADVQLSNDEFHTPPLQFAALYGSLDYLLKLISVGADLQTQDDVENTPLHLASVYGYLDRLRELILSGTYVNTTINYDCNTPLHSLDLYGHKEHFRSLIKFGAKTSPLNY